MLAKKNLLRKINLTQSTTLDNVLFHLIFAVEKFSCIIFLDWSGYNFGTRRLSMPMCMVYFDNYLMSHLCRDVGWRMKTGWRRRIVIKEDLVAEETRMSWTESSNLGPVRVLKSSTCCFFRLLVGFSNTIVVGFKYFNLVLKRFWSLRAVLYINKL